MTDAEGQNTNFSMSTDVDNSDAQRKFKYVEDKNVLYYTSLKEASKYISVKRLTAIRAPSPGKCLQAAVLR